jgi:hypothetical protein
LGRRSILGYFDGCDQPARRRRRARSPSRPHDRSGLAAQTQAE